MLHLVKVHHWLLHVGWGIIVDDVLHLDSTWPLWFPKCPGSPSELPAFLMSKPRWATSVATKTWKSRWNNSIKKTIVFCLIFPSWQMFFVGSFFWMGFLGLPTGRLFLGLYGLHRLRLCFAVFESIECIVSLVLVHISLEKKKVSKTFRVRFVSGCEKNMQKSIVS